jgi:hypothetical protein
MQDHSKKPPTGGHGPSVKVQERDQRQPAAAVLPRTIAERYAKPAITENPPHETDGVTTGRQDDGEEPKRLPDGRWSNLKRNKRNTSDYKYVSLWNERGQEWSADLDEWRGHAYFNGPRNIMVLEFWSRHLVIEGARLHLLLMQLQKRTIPHVAADDPNFDHGDASLSYVTRVWWRHARLWRFDEDEAFEELEAQPERASA